MCAETGMKTDLLGAGTRERRIDRPGVLLAALLAVMAAAGATRYGFLEHTHTVTRLCGWGARSRWPRAGWPWRGSGGGPSPPA
jgi:hypothetical protein